MKLLRKEFINCVGENVMWNRSLTKETIQQMLQTYEDTLNSCEYNSDSDFIMDGRRTSCLEKIMSYTTKEEINENDLNEAVWSFWEFINEEYYGSLNEVVKEKGISVVDASNMWNRYKEKGIICIEEKDVILNMITVIKDYLNKS